MSTAALARAAAIVAKWTGGVSTGELADEFGLSVSAMKAVIHALIPPEVIQERKADKVSATQQRFSDDDLLAMLAACAVDLNRTPGAKAFDRWAGRFQAQLLGMRFGSWAAACERAGLVPNDRPSSAKVGVRTYSEADALAAYRRILAATDKVTVAGWAKHRLPHEPSDQALRRRYGNWRRFRQAMVDLTDESLDNPA